MTSPPTDRYQTCRVVWVLVRNILKAINPVPSSFLFVFHSINSFDSPTLLLFSFLNNTERVPKGECWASKNK